MFVSKTVRRIASAAWLSVVAATPGLVAAATPNPPLICASGETCDDPGPGPGGALYDLGSLPSFLGDLQWPALPNTNSVVTTSNLSDVRGSTEVHLSPGSYGSLHISSNDVDLVCDGNATLSSLVISGSRVRVRDCRVEPGTFELEGATDVVISNVHIDANDMNDWSNPNGFHRVAIIDSTIETTGHWALYMQPQNHTNLIIARTRMEGDQQLNRFQGVRNLVIVDSAFNIRGTASPGFRTHQEVENLLMRNTHIADSYVINFPSFDGVELRNALFENSPRYLDNGLANGCWHQLGIDTVVNVTVRGSPCNTTNTNGLDGQETNIGPASGSGNPIQHWDGQTFSLPAGVGADH